VEVVKPVVSATVFVTKMVAVIVTVEVAIPAAPVVVVGCATGGCDTAGSEGNASAPHSPRPTWQPSPQ